MKVLEGRLRKAVQAVLVTLAAGTLVIPPVVVAASSAYDISPSFNTAIRIFALYTITIVFLNIMTGSFRPLLVKAFKAKTMLRFHNTTGLVGFSLAVVHGLLVIIYGFWPGFSKLGPVAIYILTVTTFTVLLRKYLKKSWRWIHRLNYVVFLVGLIHAFQVGNDVVYGGLFLRVMLFVYAALVAVGFVYRSQLALRLYVRRKRRSRKAAA